MPIIKYNGDNQTAIYKGSQSMGKVMRGSQLVWEKTSSIPCFGYLYNWHAVDDSRELTSSADWIVPSTIEVNILLTYIGPNQGYNIREAGTIYWNTASGINSLLFNAKGAGQRMYSGSFSDIKNYAKWWMINEYNATNGRLYHTTDLSNYFGLPGGWSKKSGISVRLVRTSTTLSDGETGTYIGNDDKIYSTICIGTQEWLSENLEETLYRDLSTIQFEGENEGYLTNTEWSNLTTGALCVYNNDWANACKTPLPVPVDRCYGYLYNNYVIQDSRELTSSSEWRVPLYNGGFELYHLIVYAGGFSSAGTKLKIDGTVFWNSPNSSTDDYGFSVKGGGQRGYTGVFADFGDKSMIWSGDNTGGNEVMIQFNYSSGLVNAFSATRGSGYFIRLCKDATGISDGTTTIYTGNDGKTYNAIVINELYWTTENLEETKYRNGDTIPNVTDNDTWAALTSGALCLYDNNEDYACKLPLPIEAVKYGYLYNWYAVDDSRNVANTGWRVFSNTEIYDLRVYIATKGWNYDGSTVLGLDYSNKQGKAVSSVSSNWSASTGVGAVGNNDFIAMQNISSFSGMPGGNRDYGYFNWEGDDGYYWTATVQNTWNAFGFRLYTHSTGLERYSYEKEFGLSVRLVKDATGIADGVTTIYTGNDGKLYMAVVINELYWLTQNLKETKYRNGDTIPVEIDNTNWRNLTTGARCVYDNDEDNA